MVNLQTLPTRKLPTVHSVGTLVIMEGGGATNLIEPPVHQN